MSVCIFFKLIGGEMKLLSLIILSLFLFSCAPNSSGFGLIHSNYKGAVSVGKCESYSKIGKSSQSTLFGLISKGDSSIKNAMKNGEITKIHHVDYEIKSFLGFIMYTTVVYGE